MATSSELLDQMRNDRPQPVRKAKLCGYGKWLTEQDDAISEALIFAADDDEVSGAAIFRFAHRKGWTGSLTSLKGHLHGLCLCDRVGQ